MRIWGVWLIVERSAATSAPDALGFTKTCRSTFWFNWTSSLFTAWRIKSDVPTSERETATVRIAAIAIKRFRHRFVAVSRATYPAEIGISAALCGPGPPLDDS